MKQNMIGSKYEYFIEHGASYREAMDKVVNRYGNRAKVVTQKQSKVGGVLGLFQRDVVELQGYISNEPIAKKPVADLEDEKKKILESAKRDSVSEAVLKELRELKTVVESQQKFTQTDSQEHQAIRELRELLFENELSRAYIEQFITRMRREMSVESLNNGELVHQKALEWIGESISLHVKRRPEQPNVFVLVGPTGVGKTTTIAKLSAMYRLGKEGGLRGKEVRILTIDNYRIGARQQIETYGEIMEIPVSAVETPNDMRKYLDLYADADVIFIDTIGKSPKDYATLGKMKSLLASAGNTAEVHLAMSATTKGSDMLEILQQFEPFGYQSVIITKLDETSKVGSIISALWEKRKTLSYVTTGQNVPHDIKKADPMSLLLYLEGFKVNRTGLEQRFETMVTE